MCFAFSVQVIRKNNILNKKHFAINLYDVKLHLKFSACICPVQISDIDHVLLSCSSHITAPVCFRAQRNPVLAL